jgi:hypothetical protein
LSIYVQNFIPNSCLLYPAAVVRNKAFDEALALNEDWDFLLNAVESEGGHKHPLVHVSVVGPIIHKTDRARADRRGAVNDHLLPDNMLAIYRKWPAPTNPLKAARQALFASVGIKLP